MTLKATFANNKTRPCCAAGQRDAAEKRLKSLERLLLKADPANKPHQVDSLLLGYVLTADSMFLTFLAL